MNSMWAAAASATCVIVLLHMLTVCHCASSAENFANRLLETQLRNAAREQVKMANRLTQAAIHEMQINANKLPLTKNFQTTVVNALASRGITDLNNIGRTLSTQTLRDCYQTNKFTFADAIGTARNETLQCMKDKYDEVNEIVDNGRMNITNAVANVQNVAEMIGVCNKLTIMYPSLAGLVAKGACLNAALLTIQSDTILLPINLAKRALEVRDSLSRVQTDITRCGLRIVQSISEQSIEAARAVAQCINQQASNGSG